MYLSLFLYQGLLGYLLFLFFYFILLYGFFIWALHSEKSDLAGFVNLS